MVHGKIALEGNYLCSEFMSGCKTDYTTVSANEVRRAGRADGIRTALHREAALSVYKT